MSDAGHLEASPSPPARGESARAGERAPATAPIDSGELLRGRRIVEIVHNGELYRLQSTRLGKLILTK